MHNKKLILFLFIFLIILGIIATVLTFYQEDLTNLTDSKGNASLVVTGDVMFSRKMPSVLNDNPFRYVDNITSKSDILLINFENAATDSSNAVKGDVPLKTSPSYVGIAKNNNNTVAALANNHVFDYGINGMEDTLKYLTKNNITPIGAGENVNQANAPVNFDINGRNITIFNYMDSNNFAEYGNTVMPQANDTSAGYSAYDKNVTSKQIQNAKGNGSDVVIVYMHYGNEYSRSPNNDQIAISHEVIDSGADIVVGSHTHVTQGVEIYKEKPIFYNLGNFIFDQSNSATHRAYFVEFDFVNNTGEATVYPINLINYLPHFMSAEDGKGLLEELSPQCNQMNITENGTGKLSFTLD